MRLTWQRYRYYPYERELAAREIASLLRGASTKEVDDGLELSQVRATKAISRLTYFSGYINGHGFTETIQSRLERGAGIGKNRQATRYSVHGLHEYKGKFNPQVARAILNIFEVRERSRVVDPFCGSGTTLIECAHLGAVGCGIDLNPLAIFLANAKMQMLATPVEIMREISGQLARRICRTRNWDIALPDDARVQYLRSWFDERILQTIELLRLKIRETAGDLAPLFLSITSNLLRDYSRQDPNDLRIRRRCSPLPSTPLITAFLSACNQALDRLEETHSVLGTAFPKGQAILHDVTKLSSTHFPGLFDAGITSPPYAMALPYIDTQRLSLVWLELIQPDRIMELEAKLIGSREMRGHHRHTVIVRMLENTAHLPRSEAAFCEKLQNALGPKDGFRRKAVPTLLYRYFEAMRDSFRSIRALMKPNAPFALIVGHNHTVLNGVRFDINTPHHLASLARAEGWRVEELVPLQTYQRYGYHAGNAVEAETLVFLRNS